MDVSSRGLPPLLMDLSKGFSVGRLPHSHRPQPQALDMTKKPEWYHRQPQNCSPDLPSSFRTSSLRPDLNQDPGSFMNSPLTPGLDLYHDQVRSNLWHSGFYEQSGDAGPESSGGEEEEEEEEDSDSDSDVIFLVSSTKEPLLCTSFIQDNVTHIVEPLSPAVSSLEEGRGFYHLPQTVSSPSRDSSYTEESSDSSMDIPLDHARPIVLLSDLRAVYHNRLPPEASSDDSDTNEASVPQSKNELCKKRNERDARKKPTPKARQSPRIRTPCNTPPLTPRRSLLRQVKNSAIGLYNESYDSDDVLDFVARTSSSDESPPPPRKSQRMSTRISNNKSNKAPTTPEKSPSKSPQREEPLQMKTTPTKYTENKRKLTPIVKAQKLPVAKQNGIQSKGKDASVKVKAVTKRRKKKRKFNKSGPSSLFPPIEPELALKYAYRKKRERKFDSFSPFVHMEKETCTVVNYHEEEEEKTSNRPAPCQNATGFVPTTSCYCLGRVSTEFKCTEFLKCCLCGQTANANALGDLLGPYCPAFSDGTDSRTMLNGHPENHAHEDGPEFQNKSPKDKALENGTVILQECWVHEDCSVWSTGVFLVRGKLYGLREAALLAQQTICSCCQETGAIMGCFQKGCSRNFHFSCAVQSGCVLNEDNFSMRCPDHKSKPCVSRPHLR